MCGFPSVINLLWTVFFFFCIFDMLNYEEDDVEDEESDERCRRQCCREVS